MKKSLVVLCALLSSAFACAAGPTVNPSIPAFGAGFSSAPVRQNFAAAYSDLSGLFGQNNGTTAPAAPVLGQLWLNTTSDPYALMEWDGASWVLLGTLDPIGHVWISSSAAAMTGVVGFANGGTNATSASAARASLGLAIGSNVEAWGANLDALSSLTGAGDLIPYFTGPGTMGAAAVSGDCTAAGMAFTCLKTNGTAFANSARIDTTNAANIGSGTLPAARMPTPTASTLGGIESIAGAAHNWVTYVDTLGVPHQAQPACADLSNGATGCSTAVGTSGATMPLLNAANTWGGAQSFPSGGIKFQGSSTGATTITYANTGSSNYTLGIPAVNGNVVTTGDIGSVTSTMLAATGAVAGAYSSPNVTVGTDGRITAISNGSATDIYGHIWGFGLSNDASSPNTVVDVAAGMANDHSNTLMITGSACKVNFATNGAGGLDTGTVSSYSWWAVLVINGTSGTSCLATRETAGNAISPALPSGYTYYRYVGSVLAAAGTTYIVPFKQYGRRFYWASATMDLNTLGAATTTTAITLTVPPSINVFPILDVVRYKGAAASDCLTLSSGPSTGGSSTYVCAQVAVQWVSADISDLITDTSAHLQYGGTTSTDAVVIQTGGWIDPYVAPNM